MPIEGLLNNDANLGVSVPLGRKLKNQQGEFQIKFQSYLKNVNLDNQKCCDST